jgi:hypothetical protein
VAELPPENLKSIGTALAARVRQVLFEPAPDRRVCDRRNIPDYGVGCRRHVDVLFAVAGTTVAFY